MVIVVLHSNKLIHLVLLDFKQSQSAEEICLMSITLHNGPTNQVLTVDESSQVSKTFA